MKKKTKVGLTMRVIKDEKYNEIRDEISHDWIEFLEENSIDIKLIPNSLQNYSNFIKKEEIEAVILSNGNNVIYNKDDSLNIDLTDHIRNESERKILSFCVEKKIPVLGVCRGMQFINHFFMGKLCADINSKKDRDSTHANNEHELAITYDPLKNLCGSDKTIVNSYHNQGFTEEMVADDLLVAAKAEDIVEAVIHNSLPIVGIQWHPERNSSDKKFNSALIDSLKNRFNNLI